MDQVEKDLCTVTLEAPIDVREPLDDTRTDKSDIILSDNEFAEMMDYLYAVDLTKCTIRTQRND